MREKDKEAMYKAEDKFIKELAEISFEFEAKFKEQDYVKMVYLIRYPKFLKAITEVQASIGPT